MSMGGSGGTGKALSDMNVTPLIDVLLVLIIIFMVIQPTAPKGLNTLVPQPPKNQDQTQPNDRTIVVQVLDPATYPTYKINEQTFPKQQLAAELNNIYETRQEKVMFVRGDRDIDFGKIAEVIGFGKQADVTNVAIITPKVAAGQ